MYEKDDLLICKPDDITAADDPFVIYARVVSVNPDHHTLVLDKYQKEGRLHIERKPHEEIAESDVKEYYQPMNDEEILKFRDGLTSLFASPLQAQKIDNIDVGATFEVVNEIAEKIVQENEKSVKKAPKKNNIDHDR